MKVTPIKTPIVHAHDNLITVIAAALPPIVAEGTILAITSKIIALCEGAVVAKKSGSREEKHALVMQEAERYVPPQNSKYDVILTIKEQVLAVNAGIDESNADGRYVLWPQDSYATAQMVWEWMRTTYVVKNCGVIVTDSRTIPLKWGTIGTCLAHCGFQALNNRIGEKDLFGHEMQMTQVNVAEAVAVSAVFEMGEVAESTPLALITDVSAVVFTQTPPTEDEKKSLVIAPEDDVYAPVLMSAPWSTKK